MTAHNLLITLHAMGGGEAFISGCLALVPAFRRTTRSVWLSLFLIALGLMIVTLIAVVIFDWGQFVPSQKIVFGGLCLLAIYMAWRAFKAFGVFQSHLDGWLLNFTDHIGFNLISLFDGFVIVSALDLGAPGWLVGIVAILGVVVGIWATNQVKIAETRGSKN